MKELVVHEHSKINLCFICGRKILIGEIYFKTGRELKSYSNWKIRAGIGTRKANGIKTYCSICVNKIYVDGVIE